MKILIIGGGNMGATFAKSFIRSHSADPDKVMILEILAEKIDALKKEKIGRIFSAPKECVPLADIIILAVKPQASASLFAQMKDYVDEQQVIVSIMAGVQINTIRQGLGATKIIRAMPNLPAQIGQGMTVYTSTDEVTRIELVMVQNLLNTTGKAIFVSKEAKIDAGTAISGSGPAYVFYFINAMKEAAKEMGFSDSSAQLLVTQTFKGTVSLFEQSNRDCQEWINMVSSKGGTTEAAIQSFESNQVQQLIKEGAKAALSRAIELGKM